ncbi:MAG: hypothetical protein DI539_10960 [Flavobacterium psychrophilum]|nr:MAG: hypothetical protein DI539_10960 [Flavobacterium psychrophilum]
MKQYFTLLLTVFVLNAVTAQDPGNVTGNALWLKAENTKDSLSKMKVTTEDLTVSYFNFNPIADRQSLKKPFKNIVAEQYSLFVVFKSDFEEERNILTLQRGSTKAKLTSKEVVNDREMVHKGDVTKGVIVSYLNGNNDKNGKRRNVLLIDKLFGEDPEGKEQLIELIYFPRFLSEIERQKVETYLSIKYGISITEKYDYLDSKGDKVWDTKLNGTFSNRVTGLGRDDAYGLYQKQSGNSLKDGIYIGLGTIDTTNKHNKYTLKDRSFLLWGDNGAKMVFSLDKEKILKKMERVWKMDLTGVIPQDSITTQLKISKKDFGYVNQYPGKDFLWLCINPTDSPLFDYTNAKYIRQSAEDNEFIYFDKVKWDMDGNEADSFTFIQGPEFMIEPIKNFACETETGNVSVKLIGGTVPYIVNFNGEERITSNSLVEFTDLSSGTFSLKATEAKGNTVTDEIEISAISNTSISLLPVWYINGQTEVIVKPTINTKEYLAFEWTKEGKTISSEKEFTTKTPGDYILTVSNAEGCKKSLPFKIEGNNSIASGWKVYPNPVRSGELFSLDFKLEKESRVTITIASMEGKQILYKELGAIQDFVYQDSIIISGVYLITLTIDNTTETVKLIVH